MTDRPLAIKEAEIAEAAISAALPRFQEEPTCCENSIRPTRFIPDYRVPEGLTALIWWCKFCRSVVQVETELLDSGRSIRSTLPSQR